MNQGMRKAQLAIQAHYNGQTSPYLSLPESFESGEDGCTSISTYAGKPLREMSSRLAAGGTSAYMPMDRKVNLASTVGAAMMKVKMLVDDVPANEEGCKVRLDITPDNICMRLIDGKWLPVLDDVGVGGFRVPDGISVKPKPTTTIKALDPLVAHEDDTDARLMADNTPQPLLFTDSELDYAQTALCVLEITSGFIHPVVDLKP